MSELDELEKQMAELQARMKAIIDTKRKDVLEEMLRNIHQYGITAQELGLGGKAKKVAKVKKAITFRDPDTGNEWDGDLTQKGRKPNWIAAKIEDKSIEQYRVK